jgi:phosphoesterase RecJ-like protein
MYKKLIIKDCILTSHQNPDGDAISSMVALYNFLKSHGKKVALKLSGDIPKNLQWVLDGVDQVKKIPKWAELIYVLDTAPIKERLGWSLPNLPIYNIDHHACRLNENDPNNNVYVVDCCSTACVLFNKFGIKDDILAIGAYTDTLFSKRIHEVFQFIEKLGIKEEKLEQFVSRVNVNTSKDLLEILHTDKIHKCKNGIMIVEISEEYSIDTIESFIQILMKLSETICLIYGDRKDVKLRSSNPDVDVCEIAKLYGGGGHTYASACNVKGKVLEFRETIVSHTTNSKE